MILGQKEPREGWLKSLNGNMAEIRTEHSTPISSGALVQFETDRMLYLGEVRSGNGDSLTVSIEHSLDLAQAAAIRKCWNANGT